METAISRWLDDSRGVWKKGVKSELIRQSLAPFPPQDDSIILVLETKLGFWNMWPLSFSLWDTSLGWEAHAEVSTVFFHQGVCQPHTFDSRRYGGLSVSLGTAVLVWVLTISHVSSSLS